MATVEKTISQMEACWLVQLAREFADICYQYRLKLGPPVFQLSRSKRVYGSYLSSERILSISGYLILQHPWPVTLQVLKHEMAHQICSELFHEDKAGHGSRFRQACEMIGVDPLFQKAAADTGAMVVETCRERLVSQDQHILEKVRKLLALGQSGNEHEAQLALEKAVSLLAHHNLSMESLAEENELIHATIETHKQRMPLYQRSICSLLNRWFFVQAILASRYNPHDNKEYKTIELFGTTENIAIAEHCYYFLEERLAVLWQQYKKNMTQKRRIARKSYYMGILAGFAEGLAGAIPTKNPMQSACTVENKKALVATEKRMNQFVAYHFPRLRKAGKRSYNIDRNAYEDARETGRKLKINKPVTGRTGSPRLLS